MRRDLVEGLIPEGPGLFPPRARGGGRRGLAGRAELSGSGVSLGAGAVG